MWNSSGGDCGRCGIWRRKQRRRKARETSSAACGCRARMPKPISPGSISTGCCSKTAGSRNVRSMAALSIRRHSRIPTSATATSGKRGSSAAYFTAPKEWERHLPAARFEKTRFDSCGMSYANFGRCRMVKCRLDASDFSDASFSEAEFREPALRESVFVRTDFFRTPLRGIDFTTWPSRRADPVGDRLRTARRGRRRGTGHRAGEDVRPHRPLARHKTGQFRCGRHRRKLDKPFGPAILFLRWDGRHCRFVA